jgi:hypothetical protein
MKNILPWLFLLSVQFSLWAQNPAPTESLLITGKVKKEKTYTLAQIKTFSKTELGSVNTSCSQKRKEESKGVKVVLVKDLLDSVRFDYTSPRMLNQFYFRFEASDGYVVVFSFNEIYNTETGKNLFVVTEKDGKDITEMENRILLLTTTDLKTGNRNIKNLARIVVCVAE